MEWFIAWLWQGLLLVGIVGLAFSLSPRISASTRYAIWWLTLGVVLAMPWLTAPGAAPESPAIVQTAAQAAGQAIAQPAVAPLVLPAAPLGFVLLLFTAWLVLALVRLAAVVRGVFELMAAKRSCMPFPVDREGRLSRWRAVRGDGRVASLRLSRRIRVASVLGLGRPIIAIPVRLADSLSDDELDQVVLHEHGHVRRFDDWARLCQALVEAVVGFHPAIWVAGRRLSLEREVACDDWTLARGGRRRDYAVCLTKVAGASRSAQPGLAPGLSLSQATLSRRVARLLDSRRNISVPVEPGVMVAGVGCLAIVVMMLGNLAPVVAFESIGWIGPSIRSALGDVAMTTPFEVPASMPASIPVAVASSETHRLSGAVLTERPPVTVTPVLVPASDAVVLVTRGPSGAEVRPSDEPVSLDSRERAALLAQLLPLEREVSVAGSPSMLVLQPPAADDSPRRGRWSRAADAGVAIGSKTKEAGLATANFFSRVGKKIARAF